MNKHRIAWIGGFVSPSSIRKIPTECELVAQCDICEEKLERARREAPELLITDDFHDIARMDDCDSVISFTPNGTHRDIAVSCLKGPKPVLRPITDVNPVTHLTNPGLVAARTAGSPTAR